MLDATQPGSGVAGVHAAADLPFDKKHLDDLLEAANIDILLVTSKHNVQYLLGGYRFFFFDYMDAMGLSRYLPVLFYQRGKPENSAYIGYRLEAHEKALDRFWDDALLAFKTQAEAEWTSNASPSSLPGSTRQSMPPGHERRSRMGARVKPAHDESKIGGKSGKDKS